MKNNKVLKRGLLALAISIALQIAVPALALEIANDEQYARTQFSLGDEAIEFLEEHNVDLSVFRASSVSRKSAGDNVVMPSMNDSILGLINETGAYGFTDSQIQQYVEGLVNSDPTVVTADEVPVMTRVLPMSSRLPDYMGYEVESLPGYYQSTAFATLPTVYNAGNCTVYMFYSISAQNVWGMDLGIYYSSGSGGNAWRICRTLSGGKTESLGVLAVQAPGTQLYFNVLIETTGYLRFRILNANNFSTVYFDHLYYVGSYGIYRTNGIFNRQITMTTSSTSYSSGTYMTQAKFFDAYIYSNSGYSQTNASNTSSRRGAWAGGPAQLSMITLNSYTPWHSENVSFYIP